MSLGLLVVGAPVVLFVFWSVPEQDAHALISELREKN